MIPRERDAPGIAQVTVTDPVIDGWIVQWNAYVPGAVNVCENDAPLARPPEFHDPSTAVQVCVAESLLVAVTVPPRAIVTDGGWNAKPLIAIAALIGAGAIVVVGSVGAGSVGAGSVSVGAVAAVAAGLDGASVVVVSLTDVVVEGALVVVVDAVVVAATIDAGAEAAVFEGCPPPHALRRQGITTARATVVRPRAEMGTDRCTGADAGRIAAPG